MSRTVLAEILRMKQDTEASDARARDFGLAEEELAFYDAVAENAQQVYDEPFLRDLVHDQVRAGIRSAVRRVLRRRGVRHADFEPFIERFMQQAEAQYAEWPLVA